MYSLMYQNNKLIKKNLMESNIKCEVVLALIQVISLGTFKTF